MIKIGYIFFDDIHIIPHFVGSVAELYKDPECHVDILTPETDHSYLYELLDKLNVPRTVVKPLSTYFYKKIAYKIQGRKKPSNQYVFKKHQELFLDYDVLVFNVFNQGHVKRKNKLKPKYVFLMHGAGDSYYPFTDEYVDIINEYALVTTSGKKINDLFAQNGPYPNTKFEICGYQKLDLVKKMQIEKKLFDNDKPIIFYNPHFREHLTSFHKFGLDILEFFYQNKDYNLIFAPHMNLFSLTVRNALDRKMIPEKYHNTNNIIIDFGSTNSVDMTYTYNADIYMGDVSSQVYEFLLQGFKPAIFLDAHDFKWQDDIHFRHWHLGKVINDVSRLKEILETRNKWQQNFIEEQKKAIAYTFDIAKDKSASVRVAEAIKKLALTK